MLTDIYNRPIWHIVHWVNLQYNIYWFTPPHLCCCYTGLENKSKRIMITFNPINQSYTLKLQTSSILSVQPVRIQVQLLMHVFKMSSSFICTGLKSLPPFVNSIIHKTGTLRQAIPCGMCRSSAVSDRLRLELASGTQDWSIDRSINQSIYFRQHGP